MQAQLHLWLNVRSPPMKKDAYIVGIQAVSADGKEANSIMRLMKVKDFNHDHYVIFEVGELLRDLAEGLDDDGKQSF